MVVQRRHLEQALAVRRLEVDDLQNVGQRLADVDKADGDQHERHIVGKGQRRHRAAEEQRARVAHEDLGRVEIVNEEAEKSPDERRGVDTELLIALPPDGEHSEKQADRHRHAAGEAVDAVRDVDGVDRADNDERREHHIDPPAHHDLCVEKRHIEVRRQHALKAHQAEKRDRRGKLEQELLNSREAEVLLVLHLFKVIQKADAAEDQREKEDVEVLKIPRHHALPAADHDRGENAEDEH